MHRPVTVPRRVAVAAVCVVAAVVLGACSSSGGGTSVAPPAPGTSAVLSRGDSCTDPAGDLQSTADGSRRDGPAGADLLEASAVLDERAMHVSFRTAGPVDALEDPLFLVGQGQAGTPSAYEVRIGKGPSGRYTASITTFKGGDRRQPLTDVDVVVLDDGVRADIPRTAVPVSGSLLWFFGSAAGSDANSVYDECAPLGGAAAASTTAPPTSVAGSTGTAAPATATPPPQALGTTLAAPNGVRVAVFEVRGPAAGRTLPVSPDAGNRAVAVDVELCAGTESLDTASATFALQTADNRQYRPWATDKAVVEPALPASQTIAPDQCLRGWIPFQIPDESSPARVTYDTSGSGRGPFLVWLVP